jgi:hypothetical protein
MKQTPMIPLFCLALMACSGSDAPPSRDAAASTTDPGRDALVSAATGIAAAASGQLQPLATPLDTGIELDFPYTRLMDTRNEIAGATIRQVVIEVVDLPLSEALAALRASINDAGYATSDEQQVQGALLLAFRKGRSDINLTASEEADGRGGASGRGTGSIALRLTTHPER